MKKVDPGHILVADIGNDLTESDGGFLRVANINTSRFGNMTCKHVNPFFSSKWQILTHQDETGLSYSPAGNIFVGSVQCQMGSLYRILGHR